MPEDLRSLKDFEKHLVSTPAMITGEPQRTVRELFTHLIRAQKLLLV